MSSFAHVKTSDGRVYMDFEASDQAHEFRYETKLPDLGLNGHGWKLVVGDLEVPLEVNPSQSSGDIARMALDILECVIEAEFIPQAWIDDYAREIDGAEYFDIAPIITALPLSKVKRIFGYPGGKDELAESTEAFKRHNGPFEVEVNETELVRKITLIAGQEADSQTLDILTDNVWEDFVNTYTQIQKAKEAHRQESNTLIARSRAPKTFDEWEANFKPITFHGENESRNGTLLETFGEDLDRVLQADPSTVWTLIEGARNKHYIASGLHTINRQGYFICEHPYTGPDCDFQEDPQDDDDAYIKAAVYVTEPGDRYIPLSGFYAGQGNMQFSKPFRLTTPQKNCLIVVECASYEDDEVEELFSIEVGEEGVDAQKFIESLISPQIVVGKGASKFNTLPLIAGMSLSKLRSALLGKGDLSGTAFKDLDKEALVTLIYAYNGKHFPPGTDAQAALKAVSLQEYEQFVTAYNTLSEARELTDSTQESDDEPQDLRPRA